MATDDGEGNVTIIPYENDVAEPIFMEHINNKQNPHMVTAEQIGARPNTWMPTAADVGAATPQEVNVAKTEAVTEANTHTDAAVKKAAPRNLLYNSDFRNPVNQSGEDSYTGTRYTIDRWYLWSEDQKGLLSIEDGGIALNAMTSSAVSISQRFPKGYFGDKKYTLAFQDINGDFFLENHPILTNQPGFDYIQIATTGWMKIVWVALYEGNYTLDTIPEYQPKGYEAELLICRQYDPTTAEYIGLRKFGFARNLLDNSDFRNPVNQRDKDTYSSYYGIDRWRIYSSDTSMEKKDGYIRITGAGIWQNVPNVGGKVYTLAAQRLDGQIYVCSGKFENGVATVGGELMFNFAATQYNSVYLAAGDWVWAALYEGEYTVDTLPEYQSKGYGAELAECQRYYINVRGSHAYGVLTENGTAEFIIPLPVSLRLPYPTSYEFNNSLWAYKGNGGVAPLKVNNASINSAGIRFLCTSETAENAAIVVPDIMCAVSADL